MTAQGQSVHDSHKPINSHLVFTTGNTVNQLPPVTSRLSRSGKTRQKGRKTVLYAQILAIDVLENRLKWTKLTISAYRVEPELSEAYSSREQFFCNGLKDVAACGICWLGSSLQELSKRRGQIGCSRRISSGWKERDRSRTRFCSRILLEGYCKCRIRNKGNYANRERRARLFPTAARYRRFTGEVKKGGRHNRSWYLNQLWNTCQYYCRLRFIGTPYFC